MSRYAERIKTSRDVSTLQDLERCILADIDRILEEPKEAERRKRSRLRQHLANCKSRRILFMMENFLSAKNDPLEEVVKLLLDGNLDTALEKMSMAQGNALMF